MLFSSITRKKPRVFIFQMGKVGSSALTHSLKTQGIDAEKIHQATLESERTIRENFARRNWDLRKTAFGENLRSAINEKSRDIHIITLVREPIARNISAFFQNLPNHLKDLESSGQLPVTENLISHFLNVYPHGVPNRWFDRQLKPVTGIDVLANPFPYEQRFQKFKNAEGNIHLLLMRNDLHDAMKAKIVSNFLQYPVPEIVRSNVTMRSESKKGTSINLDRLIFFQYKKA